MVLLYGPCRRGAAHRRWLGTFSFDNLWQQLALDELRRTIEDRLAQCECLEAALRKAVLNWRFYPTVLGLQAMRGVQFTTDLGVLAELGELSRFGHSRRLIAWRGVIPSEHSSVNERRQGDRFRKLRYFAAMIAISTRNVGAASFASTVARAGPQSFSTHASHTSFIASKSASMSESQI